jgi:hypothetical protein
MLGLGRGRRDDPPSRKASLHRTLSQSRYCRESGTPPRKSGPAGD